MATVPSITQPYQFVKYFLQDYFIEASDPRIPSSYWLVQNGLVNSAVLIILYLAFTLYLGPRMMANRKPFDLRWLIIIYNFCMAIWNAYFFVISLVVIEFGALLLAWDAPDVNDRSDWALFVVRSGYLYLISKYCDFFDSIFFVLRRKNSHLTFLHLYHHSSVAFLGTMCFILYPTSTPVGLFTLLNSLIHVVMYTYYGLSCFGSWMRPYLWWKKYITQIQIVQFGIYIVYFTAFLILQRGYRNFLLYIGYTQAPFFAYLFVQFYRRTYSDHAKNLAQTAIQGMCTPQELNGKIDDNINKINNVQNEIKPKEE